MIPEGNPHGRVAGKSCRDPKFKEAFAVRLWQPLSSQHLLPFIGTSEDVQVEVWVGVSSLCENPPSSGPSEPRVGLVCFVGHRDLMPQRFMKPMSQSRPQLADSLI